MALDGYEADEIQAFYASHGQKSLKLMLRLSPWERLKWFCGELPSNSQMAARIFAFLDANASGTISVSTLDLTIKQLQGQLHFNKHTFDFVEVRPHINLVFCS